MCMCWNIWSFETNTQQKYALGLPRNKTAQLVVRKSFDNLTSIAIYASFSIRLQHQQHNNMTVQCNACGIFHEHVAMTLCSTAFSVTDYLYDHSRTPIPNAVWAYLWQRRNVKWPHSGDLAWVSRFRVNYRGMLILYSNPEHFCTGKIFFHIK